MLYQHSSLFSVRTVWRYQRDNSVYILFSGHYAFLK